MVTTALDSCVLRSFLSVGKENLRDEGSFPSPGTVSGHGGKGLNIPEAPLPHAMHAMYNMFRVCEK